MGLLTWLRSITSTKKRQPRTRRPSFNYRLCLEQLEDRLSPAITLSPTSLIASMVVGVDSSQTITASGGTGSYTFAQTGGALPPGITLSPAGLLGDTPTQAGTFNFTVTATDSVGSTGGQAYTVIISQPYFSPYTVTGLNPTYVNDVGTLSNPGTRLNTTALTTTPPPNQWYNLNMYDLPTPESQGASWGPQPLLEPQPALPAGIAPDSAASFDFYIQRVFATAANLTNTPYQHHHDPLWNPYANGYSSDSAAANYWPWSSVSDNTLSNLYTPTQLPDGSWWLSPSQFPNPYEQQYGQGWAGIDCSDLTALAYNVGAGIYINPDVGKQGVVDAANVYSGTSPLGWNNTASAVFVNPQLNTDPNITSIIPEFILGPNSAYNETTNSRYITTFNIPGALDSVIDQFQPGDLLYIAASPGAASSVTHVVIWLGTYGTLADGSPSPVPLVISSHDNTPAVLDANGNMPPPGVHILPFNPDSWFYTNFSHAMRLLHVPAPAVPGTVTVTSSPANSLQTLIVQSLLRDTASISSPILFPSAPVSAAVLPAGTLLIHASVSTGSSEIFLLSQRDFSGTAATGEFSGLVVLDGKQKEGLSAGVADVTVVLEVEQDGRFVPVAVTTTDATGAYNFTGLPRGNYRVRVLGKLRAGAKLSKNFIPIQGEDGVKTAENDATGADTSFLFDPSPHPLAVDDLEAPELFSSPGTLDGAAKEIHASLFQSWSRQWMTDEDLTEMAHAVAGVVNNSTVDTCAPCD